MDQRPGDKVRQGLQQHRNQNKGRERAEPVPEKLPAQACQNALIASRRIASCYRRKHLGLIANHGMVLLRSQSEGTSRFIALESQRGRCTNS